MIRLATEEDLIGIRDIVKEVHEIHYLNRPDIFKKKNDNFDMSYYSDIIRDDKSRIYIKIIDKKIVGYLTLIYSKITNHPVIIDQEILKIEDLAVLQGYQRNGIGSDLFKEGIKYSKEINATRLQLIVWDFNKKAIEFYNKLGLKTRNHTMEYIINAI